MKFLKILIPVILIANGTMLAQQLPATVPADKTFKLFFEKVYLHTDRDYYFAGEDVWFKAYFVNALSNMLTESSNNLYVEFISPEQKILTREVVRLEKGIGNGDFKLKDSLPPGTYMLKAYTNWMRNYGDNFIFEKKIRVSSNRGVGPLAAGSSLSSGVQSSSPAPATPFRISFFPEGGSMVDDVSGLVAFKAEDAGGKPVKVSGTIISSKGDTAARFTGIGAGTGFFSFTPKSGLKYRAVSKDASGQSISSDLPASLTKGFALHIAGTDSASVTIMISANPRQIAESKNREVLVTANHGTQTFFSFKTAIVDAVTTVKVPVKDLPGGIAALTLYDDQKKPHCERLVFIPFRDNVKISISSNKTAYRPKERVVVNIKATDAKGNPVQTDLSVAVVDNTIVPAGHSNIQSYLLLESEVRGQIDNPSQYFDPANANRFKTLDMLLMTQGWRDFVWRHLTDTAINIGFMPEPGITVSGQLNQKSGGKSIANNEVTLFAGGAEDNKIYLTKTDQDGRFFFDGIKFYSGQEVSISAKDAKGRPAGNITLDSVYRKPVDPKPFSNLSTEGPGLTTFSAELQKRSADQKKQSLADTIRLKEIELRNNRNVIFRNGEVATKAGYADQVFNISSKDYDYKSLRHYLLTKVDGAMQDDSADENGILFMSQGKKVRPRFVVNRREEIFQNMQYFELPMNQIEKVTVRHLININQKDVYVIYLAVKPTAFNRQDPGQLTAKLNGYYQARTFYSPKYTGNQDVVRTDARTTIFWQPNVKTDANGNATINFFNADPKASIRVVAEGITGKGVPVTGNAAYQVN